MYHVQLTESYFPAQTDSPYREMTIAETLREQAVAFTCTTGVTSLTALYQITLLLIGAVACIPMAVSSSTVSSWAIRQVHVAAESTASRH